jgi:hypothetical protein
VQFSELISEAEKYWSRGLNAMPATEEKFPVGTWSEFQDRLITPTEFKNRVNGGAHGLCIICGKGSGNLTVVDIDHKYDLSGKLVNEYFQLIYDNDPDLFESLYIVKTPSHGYHLYFRCEQNIECQKLANRYSTEDELKVKPKEKTKVLVETKGHGGQVLCPPSPGYTIFQDRPVPTIPIDRVKLILDLARSFNEVYEVKKAAQKQFNGDSPWLISPWDDFDQRGDIIPVLERNQWKQDRKQSPRIYFTRPGKDKGTSADYHEEKKLFKCWSTSVSEFEDGKAYSHTAVFALLECNGDFSRACSELQNQGYGKRKPVSQKSDERENGNTTTFQKSEKSPEPATLESFDNLLVTKEKNIPQPEPVVTIHGGSFAIAGNISSIGAAPKSAKTTVAVAMAAGAISETGDIEGFPDIKIKPNTEQKAAVYIDTEQSEADQQHQVRIALKRAGLETTPDHFRCYNLVSLDYKKYMEVTDTLCQLLSENFGGIHLIVIDGGADFIASVNDEEKSVEIIQYFRHLSIRHNCPVIIIVHQNPGSEKERGHLGSEIQRKCYGLLSIEKKGEIFTIQPKMMRRAGNSDVPLIQFQYSLERGYHVQVDTADQEAAKDREKWEKLEALAHEVFKPFDAYREIDAYSAIMQHTKKGVSTAKGMLYNMRGFGILKQSADKLYRLNMDNRSTGQNRSENRSDNL